MNAQSMLSSSFASMSVTIDPVLPRGSCCRTGRGRQQTAQLRLSASPMSLPKNCQPKASTGSVDVLGHPTEAVSVSHAADHTAHENFNGAHVGIQLDGALSGGVVCEAEAVAEFVF